MKSNNKEKFNIVGFFPGIGSRSNYKNLFINSSSNLSTLNLVEKYRKHINNVEVDNNVRVALFSGNTDFLTRLEFQAYTSIILLVNNLIAFDLVNDSSGNRIDTVSGESFGIICAAVAAGSVTIEDAIKISCFLVPYVDYFNSVDNISLSDGFDYYLDSTSRNFNIDSDYHVMSLKCVTNEMYDFMKELRQLFSESDVEVHKYYSNNQVNVYVRDNARSCFELFVNSKSYIECSVLKSKTKLIFHSRKLEVVVSGFDKFIEENVSISTPRMKIISNSGSGVLDSSYDVKIAFLSIINSAMYSRETVSNIRNMNPDCVVELGLGNKSYQLFMDNNVDFPVIYANDFSDFSKLVNLFRCLFEILGDIDGHDVLTKLCLFFCACRNYSCDLVGLVKKICDKFIVNDYTLYFNGLEIRLSDVIKQSELYSKYISDGEVVIGSRLKRNLIDTGGEENKVYGELLTFNSTGDVKVINTPKLFYPEKYIISFSNIFNLSDDVIIFFINKFLNSELLDDIDEDIKDFIFEGEGEFNHTILRRIVFQYLYIKMLISETRNTFIFDNFYLHFNDLSSALSLLLYSGSLSFSSVKEVWAEYLKTNQFDFNKNITSSKLKDSDFNIVTMNGDVIHKSKDILGYLNFFMNTRCDINEIKFNCDMMILSLDESLSASRFNSNKYLVRFKLLNSYDYKCLNDLDRENYFRNTKENHLTNFYASKRNITPSVISSYLNSKEQLVDFCSGGSESMTFMFRKFGNRDVFVRKILSESLTAVLWDSEGVGVMLPPFEKASRQVEYLNSLPVSIKSYFPLASNIISRDICSLDYNKNSLSRELIYDMNFISGMEVSKFIEQYKPHVRVISKIYEIIFLFLSEYMYIERKKINYERTINISYLRKIEERINLCIKTAPKTFNTNLIDSEYIYVSGVKYMNIKPVLRFLRSNPDFINMLEPKYHSLVMGDTNTENIKIGNIEKLIEINEMIKSGAPEKIINKSIESLNIDNLDIKFLDPRAIGFESTGTETVDDYMYDNKPWHNSIGHYDEIHNELFDLDFNINDDGFPSFSILFHPNNSYQLSYKVYDHTHYKTDLNSSPIGMEKMFKEVMCKVYKIYDKDSDFIINDPNWLIRFVFMMGTHFAAMPPFHFSMEDDGSIKDSYLTQKRPIAIYCEGIKWLNWAIELYKGERKEFLGIENNNLHTVYKEAI